jgi:hypothetical protein
MKYRSKKTGEIIEAVRWFENGDHPNDDVWRNFEETGNPPTEPREGKIVRYFRSPHVPGEKKCALGCGFSMHWHGWIDNPSIPGYVSEDGIYSMAVCPGDYVITKILSSSGFFSNRSETSETFELRTAFIYKPMHPKEFEEKYEAVKEPEKDEYVPTKGSGFLAGIDCPYCKKVLKVSLTIEEMPHQ